MTPPENSTFKTWSLPWLNKLLSSLPLVIALALTIGLASLPLQTKMEWLNMLPLGLVLDDIDDWDWERWDMN